jgi:ketosteroid isomerase-like protein
VISAAAGRVTTDRTELDSAIGTFWQYVGQNMRDPQWVWHDVHVDVLSRDAAVVTASYTIPHHTPAGRPHTIAGAWTAVFQRRNGRWVVVQEHLSDVPVSEDSLPVEHH